MGLIFQYISIFIELLIAVMGLLIVFRKKKKYGWFIFLTFFIYVLYDSSKLLDSYLNSNFWSFMFFIATISAFYAVWQIFKDKKETKEKLVKEKQRGKKK